MDVTYVDQGLATPKRVCVDNSGGSSEVVVSRGEPLVYELLKGNLNYVRKLEAEVAKNFLFAGVSRKDITIPAGQKGFLEIDEPGSITEALVLFQSSHIAEELLTLQFNFDATHGGLFVDDAGLVGCGAGVLLEDYTAEDVQAVRLKKVYLDVGNRQKSYVI